jgi:cob(I)alamin adenosyltransferase
MQALESAIGMIANEPLRYDMLVLDEVLGAVSIGVIEESLLINFLKTKPDHMEILLSGRDASVNIVNAADYVSDIKCVKHPYNNSISARRGIEY